MRSFFLFGLSVLLIPVAVQAQPAAKAPDMAADGLKCFENLTTPEFPKAALQDHVDGTVWTTTESTPQGAIGHIDTKVVSAWSNGAELLTPPVEKAIRAAKVKPDCAGKKIAMVFRYQLYGEPTANPKAESRTEAPDIMWIESQPEPAAAHH